MFFLANRICCVCENPLYDLMSHDWNAAKPMAKAVARMEEEELGREKLRLGLLGNFGCRNFAAQWPSVFLAVNPACPSKPELLPDAWKAPDAVLPALWPTRPVFVSVLRGTFPTLL